MKFGAVSLFSGAGGMDIGIRQAGFHVLAAIEADGNAAATLVAAQERERNGTKVVHADIRRVDPVRLMRRLGLEFGGLDLLFGGPPCQAFSLIGKQKGLADARGPLLFEVVRFAAAMGPKVILIEQVKGLLSSKGDQGRRGAVFRALLTGLEEIGYDPRWRTLLAADYGVPQLRERLFVVATRGRNRFRFPERTHAPAAECGGLFAPHLQPYVGVGSAIHGLGPPFPKRKDVDIPVAHANHVDVTPARDRERIALVPEGGYLAQQTHLGADLLCGLTVKDTTKYLRMHRERPANTLRCGEIFYHPTEARYLTPKEYLRLHGYPDDYRLIGPVRARTGVVRSLDQHRLVANSVPPPVALVLGRAILDYLWGWPFLNDGPPDLQPINLTGDRP